MSTRATRASSSKNADKTPASKRVTKKTSRKEATPDSDDGGSADAYDEEEEEDSDVESINSDNLDDEPPKKASQKRKRASTSSPKKKSTPRKKRKAAEDEDDDDELELAEGQEIVGAVVQAPKTGRVPPGQISKNTLDFLSQLKKPECNDRQWFKLHEPVYRVAEKEWKDFIEAFTETLTEVDPQIPYLPPKDVIHRIYRDVRFSNDKTPYKTGLSATFSRGGRKGIFAVYHVVIRSGRTMIAAGAWQPGKNEIATMRSNIARSPNRLRRIISAPDFVKLFGPPRANPKGGQSNIFGHEDELKSAPKGYDKNHKDIDLLKCRSFVVHHYFTDEEVLQPDFKDELGRIAKIMRPFVHCLNDLMTIRDADDSDSEDENEGQGEENEEDEEDADEES